jgi:lysophospholipase L1-like esterase
MTLDTALKLALAPLLISQALQVRRRALVLPEPSGERMGNAGYGPELGLLIVGDSSAAGVGATTQTEALSGQLVARLGLHHRVRWRLIARSGATTADIFALLNEAPSEQYDIAVTALGVNDVTRGVRLARWLELQAELRAHLADRFAVRHVVQSGLPPMGDFPALPRPLRQIVGLTARRFDAALAGQLAGAPAATHVWFDMALTPGLMAADGFHPGTRGYARWAEMLTPVITGIAERG